MKDIDTAMAELAALGIVPDSELINEETNTNNISAEELQLIQNMERVVGNVFSDEQKKILTHKGNACIIACAGSGKTTIVTNLIAKRIMTREIKNSNKLICTTYSKGGATEMEERLHALLDKFHMDRPIKVVTMHAWFYSIIRTFGVTLDVIEESERNKLIRESAKEANFELRDDDLQVLSNLISYQVNNLMSDKKALESEANTLDELTLDKYAMIRGGYAKKKAKLQKLDFDDMQMYLYKWLVKDTRSENEAERNIGVQALNYCKYMWDDFFVDEAQDISKIQFAIIKEILCKFGTNELEKSLIFVGDDDQCIYQWRGADPSIILNICNQFDMPALMLSTNYRCKNNIVDFAARAVSHNSSRYNKSMKAFNQGGNVKIATCNKKDLNALTDIAYKHIKNLINNGENPSDIAVMSRNNFHLALLSNRLLHDGIYTTCTADMKLTNSAMYKDIKTIMNMVNDGWDANITRGIMWKLCRYMSAANAGAIASFQDSTGLSLVDTLGYILKYFDKNSKVDFDKTFKIPLQAEEAMRQRWMRISYDTAQSVYLVWRFLNDPIVVRERAIANGTDTSRANELYNEERNKSIMGLFTLYLESFGALVYKREDKSRSIKGLCNYMYLLLKDFGYDNTMDFLRITEQYEHGSMIIPGDKVTLTTVHSAKGKEWKNVIAFACDDVSMPSMESIIGMLKDGQSVHDINSYIDEERRLYYVEMTRAKDNLLAITYDIPSIFLMESLEAIKGDRKDTNFALIEYASMLSNGDKRDYENIFDYDKLNSQVLKEDGAYYYKIAEGE